MKDPGRNETKEKKILIAEDSEIQLLALKRILVSEGYEVILARDGAEGLEMARTHRPDLVITDVLMPVMDGYQLCRKIKDDPDIGSTPLILLTQLEEISEVLDGLDSGADNYLTKPYDAGYLLHRVGSLLEDAGQYVNNPDIKATEFTYNGKRHAIRSGRGQTIGFLLSTYENAIIINRSLVMVQEELRALNEQLNRKVAQRTASLTAEVAERKQAEEALKESEEKFRAVVTGANDAIICIEAPDTITMWNDKAQEIFGYKASEAIGKGLHGLLAPEKYLGAVKEALPLFFKTGTGGIVGKTRELSALRKDGTEIPIELSVAAVSIHGKWNAIGTARDITERKRLEAEMRQNLEEVERMNKLMVGRELRMEELRQRARELEEKVKSLNGYKGRT